MGCPSLPYLEENDLPIFLAVWKKSVGRENCENYYPFGLSFNSYSRESSIRNRYLYNQGAGDKKFNTERIFDLDLNVDQSQRRTFDYITGRWWQVDPKGDAGGQESWSTYQFSFNNPIRYNDPIGDCPSCVGAFVGGLMDYAVQVTTNVVENGGNVNLEAFTNVDLGSIALSAGTGAAGVGIANSFSKLAKLSKLTGAADKVMKTGTDMAADATSSMVGSVVQGNEITVESVVADMVGGAAGRKIETNVKSAAQNSPQGKALQKDAKRAENLNNGRQSRRDKANAAKAKSEDYGSTKAAAAGATGSNATSKVVNVITTAVEKKDKENKP